MYRQLLAPDDPRIAAVLNARGTVRQHLERLDDAMSDFEAALRIYQSKEGAFSADAAATLSNIAQIAHTRGDYAHAEQRYREVLKIARATLSPADPALGVRRGSSEHRNCNKCSRLRGRLQPCSP